MDRVPHGVGLYLAFVQFFFTLTWTVYVIFLPQLAAQAGIPKQAVIYILLADQIVFVFMDYAMGVAADRVSRTLGRLGYAILSVTLVSCVAFLLLPFASSTRASWLLLLLIALWTTSSSALRAPPLVLIGKYAAQPSVPWLSALSLFGLGLAGAISPYLTVVLRQTDPRLPFAISSIALAAATLGIMWAERALAASTRAISAQPRETSAAPKPRMLTFLIAVLLLGIAFQIHFSLNSASLYLRLAKNDQLPYLMPVFWIGFNVLMLPASLATNRYGGLAVAAAGAAIAAVAALAAVSAGNIEILVAMQFIAGGGWGCVLMSAVAAALAVGHTGREGKLTGALFSMLALAAAVRIAMIAAELNKDPAVAPVLIWLPALAWLTAALFLLLLPRRTRAPVPATV